MPNAAAWLAAANPFRENPTREQALMAGRWSSLALIMTASVGLLQALMIWLNRDRTIAAMGEFMDSFTGAMPDAPPEFVENQSAMMQAMMPGMILQSVVWTALFAVVYLALAKVQWDKPTRWIPIVFLVISGLSLFSALTNAMMRSAMESAAMTMPDGAAMPMPGLQMTGIPPWLFTVMGVESALALLLHITGLRGALALKRMADRAAAR